MTTKSITKGYTLYLVLLSLFFLFVNTLNSQVAIIYPTASENITSGYSSSKLHVKLSFANTCDPANENKVQISLPENINYVPGSVATTAFGSLGILEDDISNLRKPIFKFSGNGTEITFSINRIAGCVDGVVFKDSIEVIGASCTTQDFDVSKNNYNINAASLTLISPTPIVNATIGSTATRSIRITNGGNGAIDTVYFYVRYQSSAVENSNNNNKITIGGVDFDPFQIIGDTILYKIFGNTIFGGDNKLDPSESIILLEPIIISSCYQTSTFYGTSWTADGSTTCQSTTTTGTITMVEGAANYATAPLITDINYTNICAPWQQSVTLKNEGSGNLVAASMYNVKTQIGSYSSGGSWGSTGLTFDLSNFSINGSAVPYTGSSTTYYVIDLEDFFTFDPDGPGGLEDLDGDGYYDDLASGETVNLTWDIIAKCGINCGIQTRLIMGFVLKYEDMCGNPISSIVRSTETLISESGFGTNSYFPSNITEGVPYTFEFDYSMQGNSNKFHGASGRYKYRLVLPPGLSVASPANAKYNGVSVGYTMSGDTVIITSNNNALRAASIDLVYTCAGNGTGALPLWHSLEKLYDGTVSCACNVQLKYCSTIYTYAQCPEVCPKGPTSFNPTVRRTDGSLGWTDHTLSTRQVASNISAYDLSKALYLDTIQITGSAIQNNDASNLHLRLELPKTAATSSGINKLTSLGASVEIWRSGTLIHTCNVTSASDVSVVGTQKIDWNICLPAGGIKAGDSIFTLSNYFVSANVGLPREDIQSGGTWYFYNDIAGVEEKCNAWTPEMYLVGTNSVIGSNTTNASGCSSFVPGSGFAYMARRFSTVGQEFKSEFRPMFYIDSIVFEKTDGYDFISAALSKSSGPYGTPSINVPITPDYVVGNKYTFINNGAWPIFGVTKQNNYGGNFKPTVSTNCKTSTKEVFNTKIYAKDYYYAFGNPSKVPATYQYVFVATSNNIASGSGWNYTLNYAESTRPDITIQNMTGTIQAASGGSQYWDVKISNNSIGNASYIWIALEKGNGTGTINVSSIEDLSSGNTLASEGSYACSGTTGYRWYKVSTSGLASGQSNIFRVHFTPNNCAEDSLLFRAGWNCSGYPLTNPCDAVCYGESTYLKVKPESAQVQLSILRQPGAGNKLDLCTDDYVTVLVSSTQGADLINPYLTFTPPTGMSVKTGQIEVEYPLNSGNIQTPVITNLPGGVIKIDLNSHTAISGDGILGIINAGTEDETKASVKIPFELFCDYISGKSIAFRGYGAKPCNNPAEGNGKSVTTMSIKINGVSEDGGATSSFLSTAPLDLACDSISTIEHVATTYGASSVLGDTLVYTLPAGITYNGNFSSTPTSIVIVSGNVVKIPIPVGTSNITTQFDVKSDCNNCNSSSLQASYQRDVVGLSCGGVVCAGVKKEMTGNSLDMNCYDPLPITLLDFSANSEACEVTIQWSTATERNNDYFEVYRSLDGKLWDKIAVVKGSGNSSVKNDYAIQDNDVLSDETYYYYLNQVDYDGRSEAFNPVSVYNTCNEQAIKIYPNPTNDMFEVELPFINTKGISIEILDNQGKLVQSFTSKEQNSVFKNSIKHLPKGVYQVKVSSDEHSFSMVKLVKI